MLLPQSSSPRLCGPSPCPAQVVDCEVDVLAGTAGGERYLDAGGLQEREVRVT